MMSPATLSAIASRRVAPAGTMSPYPTEVAVTALKYSAERNPQPLGLTGAPLDTSVWPGSQSISQYMAPKSSTIWIHNQNSSPTV